MREKKLLFLLVMVSILVERKGQNFICFFLLGSSRNRQHSTHTMRVRNEHQKRCKKIKINDDMSSLRNP